MTLEWWRTKFSAEEFIGVEIRWAALSGGRR
jgi:hypothetical protein